MKIEVDKKLLEKVVSYLASKPYVEVVQLITELSVEISASLKAKQNTNTQNEAEIRQP